MDIESSSWQIGHSSSVDRRRTWEREHAVAEATELGIGEGWDTEGWAEAGAGSRVRTGFLVRVALDMESEVEERESCKEDISEVETRERLAGGALLVLVAGE